MKAHLLTIIAFSLALSANGHRIKERKRSGQSRDKFMFSVIPAIPHFQEQVPFNNSQELIVVPVIIKGVIYRFVFDTGAITILSKELQEKLNLNAVKKMQLTDASGSVAQQSFYELDTMEIGGVKFCNIGVSAVPLEQFKSFSCAEIDGFIGTNIMRSCFWKIDFEHAILSLSDQPYTASGQSWVIPFEESVSGSPNVTMTVGSTGFKALWDSGNNTNLSLPDSLFFKSSQKRSKKIASGNGSVVQTAYGREPYKLHQALLDSIYLDQNLIKQEWATIQPAPTPMIGTRFMKRFGTLYLDYKDKKITLDRTADPIDKSVNETFGFTPGIQGDVLKVIFLWDNSNAAQQGLKVGDTITSIAGIETSTLSNEKWCTIRNMLKSLGSETTVTISVKNEHGNTDYALQKEQIVKD